jgi:hypothetical protein
MIEPTCTCTKCGNAKPLDDFYTCDRTCKECRKAMVRANRASRAEHYREFDRARANRPDRVAMRKAYAATQQGKEARRRARVRWQADNARQRAANVAVGNALRKGRLFKSPCWECGALDVEGHHPDYDAPLDVVWLCVTHHKQLHAEYPR